MQKKLSTAEFKENFLPSKLSPSKRLRGTKVAHAVATEKIEQLIVDSYNKSRKSWVEKGLVPPL
jgi:hypothetical protein